MQRVVVQRTRRLLAGHPWVFSNELAHSPRGLEPGGIVELVDERDHFLGMGTANPRSLIAVRVLSRELETIDASFFVRRIQTALERRAHLAPDTRSGRVVFSEGDDLPGLIVDRYGDCVVVQLSTAGMDRLREPILEAIDQVLAPRTVVLRNDSRSRLLEGLPQEKQLIRGSLDPLPIIEELGVHFQVDPLDGQKTGFFFDQRENRILFSLLARGQRALDLFCYSGGWSLHLAAAGFQVTAIDESARAIAALHANAALNGWTDLVESIQDDVFSRMPRLVASGARFDAVVVDPPAFVKSKQKLKEATRAYRTINAQALRLVEPGGLCASSSCSYHMTAELFVDTLRAAAQDARRRVRLVELRGQATDHPVLLHVPETAYLKCALLEVW
ncbi:MAG: class I SAM-dependent rRNA methyltransferase [Pseudomonadota bacterium]